MAKKILRVVVKASRWYRGRGSCGSALRREQDGKQCCLGFACRASGLRAREIEGEGMPRDLCDERRPDWASNPAVVDRLAKVNDNDDISDTERKTQIRTLGRTIGLQFVFVK